MFEDDKPQEVVAEGKTVDEAIRKGLIAGGWLREQVDVEVLDPGSRSVWTGDGLARVRLSRRTADALTLAQEVTSGVLGRMGLAGTVQAEQRADHIRVLVQGDGLEEALVGEGGEALDALQHLVTRIVSRQSGSRQMVNVDLGGYRERRERRLKDMAYEIADQVRLTGEQVLTEPMAAAERRVVHLALNEDPDITTFAIGDGLVKQIAIAPIDQAPPPEARRSSDRRGGRDARGQRGGRWDGGPGRERGREERGRGERSRGGRRRRGETGSGEGGRGEHGREGGGVGQRGGGRDRRPRRDRERDRPPRARSSSGGSRGRDGERSGSDERASTDGRYGGRRR